MHSSILRLSSAAVLATAIAACGPTPTEPSHFSEFQQTDLRLGTGTEAALGDTLSVDYTLWLYNATAPDNKGPLLDTSLGSEPFSLVLGRGDAIPGWDQGLAGMRAGGLRRLVIPPSLAYGRIRSGPAPPNATLVFEVELLTVE
jgi:FKBP-type peptidyl-prolyl cis-trans isomerase FkpA